MKRSLLVLLPLLLVASASIVAAQDKKPKKLPKSGLLASTSVKGASDTVVTDTFGGEDLTGTEIAPITGSVSRLSQKSWAFKVFNNSDDIYSFSVDLNQKNDDGAIVKYGSFSFQLKGKASDYREVQTGLNASGADLILRSYRNITAERAARQAP